MNLCPGLCVSTPNGPVCMCSVGYLLKNTDDKKKECVKPNNHLIAPNSCNPNDQFQCVGSKQCISKKHICDGDSDCGDGSDEDTSMIGPCCKIFFSNIFLEHKICLFI